MKFLSLTIDMLSYFQFLRERVFQEAAGPFIFPFVKCFNLNVDVG